MSMYLANTGPLPGTTGCEERERIARERIIKVAYEKGSAGFLEMNRLSKLRQKTQAKIIKYRDSKTEEVCRNL